MNKLTRIFIGINLDHTLEYSKLTFITTREDCDWYKMENGHPVQQTKMGRIRLVSTNNLPKEIYEIFKENQ